MLCHGDVMIESIENEKHKVFTDKGCQVSMNNHCTIKRYYYISFITVL